MVDDSVGWGFWPSVENYIVDASILDSGLRSWITKGESHWMTSFGVLFGVFTGQFLRHFGVGYEFDRTHVISSF